MVLRFWLSWLSWFAELNMRFKIFDSIYFFFLLLEGVYIIDSKERAFIFKLIVSPKNSVWQPIYPLKIEWNFFSLYNPYEAWINENILTLSETFSFPVFKFPRIISSQGSIDKIRIKFSCHIPSYKNLCKFNNNRPCVSSSSNTGKLKEEK